MQKQVTSDKISVTGEDTHRKEETEKPRYPKAPDVGRIVIDEIPEGKQPLIKRGIPKRDKVKETRVDVEMCDEVEGRQASHLKEDVVKVGRLNITDYEDTTREFHRPKIHQMVICFSNNCPNMPF